MIELGLTKEVSSKHSGFRKVKLIFRVKFVGDGNLSIFISYFGIDFDKSTILFPNGGLFFVI